MPMISGLVFIRDSDKANLYEIEDDESVAPFWIPKSQIEDTDMELVGDRGYIEIPKWIVVDKELDPYIDED